jgi:hypothetical protein
MFVDGWSLDRSSQATLYLRDLDLDAYNYKTMRAGRWTSFDLVLPMAALVSDRVAIPYTCRCPGSTIDDRCRHDSMMGVRVPMRPMPLCRLLHIYSYAPPRTAIVAAEQERKQAMPPHAADVELDLHRCMPPRIPDR